MVGLEGEMQARHWLGVGRCSGDEDSESKETLSGGQKGKPNCASLCKASPPCKCRTHPLGQPPPTPQAALSAT